MTLEQFCKFRSTPFDSDKKQIERFQRDVKKLIKQQPTSLIDWLCCFQTWKEEYDIQVVKVSR